MKTITCRDHGGTFQIQPRRGRPPVRCGGDYPQCSRAKGETRSERAASVAQVTHTRRTKAEREEQTIRAAVSRARQKGTVEPSESPVEATEPSNVSVPLALNVKAQLEPLGWVCTARTIGAQGVEFSASRGTERILIVWKNGECFSQSYTLWDTDKASANGIPPGKRKLSFDPDEMTDKELIEKLSGMTVVWWNRLGQGEEKATLPNRVQITHTYNGVGDEAPADRVVTFVDMAGSGYRSFRVGALMRIGK